MRYTKMTRYALLLALGILGPVLSINLVPRVHAATYSIGTLPFIAQEGTSITIVFSVSGALGGVSYQFRFFVRDPATKIHQSILLNYTTLPGQTQFTLPPFLYPTPSFPGPNWLVGQYIIWADQVSPIAISTVASTYFFYILTDATEYQRTQTVNIQATGYNASESVTVKIATQSPPTTTVFTQTTLASPAGKLVTNWKIPRNATIDSNGYLLTLTGTSTVKSPADAQGFTVRPADMSVSALTSLKSTYQRTETMSFSFQPVYPDGSIASTGVALLNLMSSSRANVTLTTSYSGGSQTFNATYKTTVNNQTGTWTASLASNGYADAYGNAGPKTRVTTSPQLIVASLTLNIVVASYFALGQQVKFNATISYPDGSQLRSGSVGSYLLFSGSPPINDTVPIIFDTGLNLWVGTYPRQPSDPGGLWSLVVKGVDSSTPPNTGSATRAINLQDNLPVASFTASPTTAQTAIPIIFNATSSYDPDGTIVSYSWNFGDGIIGSGETPSHSYNIAGVYTVTLTVTDNSGSTASTSSKFTITASTSSSSGNVSFPLYYFGILAALIGAILAGGFLAVRRHKVTHAKLKIDLEAVKSEAGRIENQEFFQSVKDQLKKDKDD